MTGCLLQTVKVKTLDRYSPRKTEFLSSISRRPRYGYYSRSGCWYPGRKGYIKSGSYFRTVPDSQIEKCSFCEWLHLNSLYGV